MSFMEDLWVGVQPHLGWEAEVLASGLQLGKAPGGQGVICCLGRNSGPSLLMVDECYAAELGPQPLVASSCEFYLNSSQKLLEERVR